MSETPEKSMDFYSVETPAKFDAWCIVEVMGRRVYGARVTEQTLCGATFIRIDVPENALLGQAGFTKLLTAGSIYAITPCSEETARRVAARSGDGPMHVYEAPLPGRLNYEEDLDE